MSTAHSYEETITRLKNFAKVMHHLKLDPPYQWAAEIRAQLKTDLETVVADFEARQEQKKDMTVETEARGICTCGDEEQRHDFDAKLGQYTFCMVAGCKCQQYEWVINAYIPISRR